jgi:hypothetical protein
MPALIKDKILVLTHHIEESKSKIQFLQLRSDALVCEKEQLKSSLIGMWNDMLADFVLILFGLARIISSLNYQLSGGGDEQRTYAVIQIICCNFDLIS